MKVIATATGFYGRLRFAGDTFEVPDDAKATWFKKDGEDEAKAKSAKAPKKAAEPDAGADESLT